MQQHNLLVINLGSTSTKYAVYCDETCVFEETIRHPSEELGAFPDILSQREYRETAILQGVEAHGFSLEKLTAIVARGGLTEPLPGGTFVVDEAMLTALCDANAAKHASSLSGVIGYDIAQKLHLPVYTVDPVVTDEMSELAHYSGLKDIRRRSIFHALNQKSVARHAAKQLEKRYEDCRFIVVHLGGGISVGAHENGKVIDTNNALDGDGPFSPDRTGGLPFGSVVDLCFSGKYSRKEIYDMFIKRGGLMSYIGTNDGRTAENMASAGEHDAAMALEAMAYQVSKEIGAQSTVLCGKIDAIVLTGGLAHSKLITGYITERVSFLAPVLLFPGENEMLALTEGALRALRGEETPKRYSDIY